MGIEKDYGDDRPIVVLSAAKDLIAACHRHEILRYAQDDRSVLFTAADALAKSIWPAYLALSAAITPPMSLTVLAPAAATASRTAASTAASSICLGRKRSMTAISAFSLS